MEVRVLQPEEYVELAGAGDGYIPDPHNSLAAAAFDSAGALVGRLMVVDIAHLECPWIREDHRGGTLLKRMEKTLVGRLKDMGLKKVACFAAQPEFEDYLKRDGYRQVPVTVWAKEI